MKWLKGITWATVGVLVLFTLLISGGSVGFTYPRVIQKEPLIAPIKVVSVENQILTLADGRSFELESGELKNLEEALRQSNHLVDIEGEISDDHVAIYANRKGWICGTPWASSIRIPLFPETVYRDKREMIGIARQHGERRN